MKKIVEGRLKFLYKGERFAIIMFLPLGLFNAYTYPDLQLYSLFSYWISFFLLEFILIQGSYYWYSKWKRLKVEKKSITPIRVVKNLKKLKAANISIIIVTVIAFIIDLNIHYPYLPTGALLVSIFVFTFAILEFINYFYVQLIYDNRSDLRYLLKTKKLKRARLNVDLKRVS